LKAKAKGKKPGPRKKNHPGRRGFNQTDGGQGQEGGHRKAGESPSKNNRRRKKVTNVQTHTNTKKKIKKQQTKTKKIRQKKKSTRVGVGTRPWSNGRGEKTEARTNTRKPKGGGKKQKKTCSTPPTTDPTHKKEGHLQAGEQVSKKKKPAPTNQGRRALKKQGWVPFRKWGGVLLVDKSGRNWCKPGGGKGPKQARTGERARPTPKKPGTGGDMCD